MTRFAALMIVAVTSVGCASSGEDEPSCEPTDTQLPETGIALGVGGADSFHDVIDAGEMELVLGNQGGWMVQPTMRLAMGDVDVGCLDLEVGVDIQIIDSDLTANLPMTPMSFTEVDGTWYSEPLYVFLSLDVDELAGRSATVAAQVSHGADDVVVELDAVTLVNAE